MLDHTELIQAQLTFLVERDPVGYDRAIQALEDLKIDGREKEYCFLGFYVHNEEHKNWIERVIAYNDIRQACSAFIPQFRILTAIELAVLDCRPRQPLTKYEQAFLNLCKLVRESCSPQATGSEE
jgi:hypothetical protein